MRANWNRTSNHRSRSRDRERNREESRNRDRKRSRTRDLSRDRYQSRRSERWRRASPSRFRDNSRERSRSRARENSRSVSRYVEITRDKSRDRNYERDRRGQSRSRDRHNYDRKRAPCNSNNIPLGNRTGLTQYQKTDRIRQIHFREEVRRWTGQSTRRSNGRHTSSSTQTREESSRHHRESPAEVAAPNRRVNNEELQQNEGDLAEIAVEPPVAALEQPVEANSNEEPAYGEQQELPERAIGSPVEVFLEENSAIGGGQATVDLAVELITPLTPQIERPVSNGELVELANAELAVVRPFQEDNALNELDNFQMIEEELEQFTQGPANSENEEDDKDKNHVTDHGLLMQDVGENQQLEVAQEIVIPMYSDEELLLLGDNDDVDMRDDLGDWEHLLDEDDAVQTDVSDHNQKNNIGTGSEKCAESSSNDSTDEKKAAYTDVTKRNKIKEAVALESGKGMESSIKESLDDEDVVDMEASKPDQIKKKGTLESLHSTGSRNNTSQETDGSHEPLLTDRQQFSDDNNVVSKANSDAESGLTCRDKSFKEVNKADQIQSKKQKTVAPESGKCLESSSNDSSETDSNIQSKNVKKVKQTKSKKKKAVILESNGNGETAEDTKVSKQDEMKEVVATMLDKNTESISKDSPTENNFGTYDKDDAVMGASKSDQLKKIDAMKLDEIAKGSSKDFPDTDCNYEPTSKEQQQSFDDNNADSDASEAFRNDDTKDSHDTKVEQTLSNRMKQGEALGEQVSKEVSVFSLSDSCLLKPGEGTVERVVFTPSDDHIPYRSPLPMHATMQKEYSKQSNSIADADPLSPKQQADQSDNVPNQKLNKDGSMTPPLTKIDFSQKVQPPTSPTIVETKVASFVGRFPEPIYSTTSTSLHPADVEVKWNIENAGAVNVKRQKLEDRIQKEIKLAESGALRWKRETSAFAPRTEVEIARKMKA